jgi:hypothetical protein
VKALDWADKHPVTATCLLAVAVFLGLHVWAAIHDGPLLLSRADPERRLALYGQLAATAVAVLGISLTVLAILLALPERPAIADIRESDTWPRLRGLLLTIAVLALAALVAAHLGSAIDDTRTGREWLEQILLACVFVTVLALLAAGLTFWLVLTRADDPEDPSRGRGQGS